jgi:hypothetical protein
VKRTLESSDSADLWVGRIVTDEHIDGAWPCGRGACAASCRRMARRIAPEAAERYDGAKEAAMIELTPEQLRALDAPPQPAVAIDPRNGQEYLLIRREIYELVRGTLKPYGRGWDDPADDDLIRKDA